MPAGKDNETKRLIRETATRLFRENSFDSVTIHDICRASGVNKHTFYYYFQSKDDLLKNYYIFSWHLTASETADILTSESCMEQTWLIVKKILNFFTAAGAPIFRQILIKNLTEDIGTFRLSDEMKEIFRLETSIIEKGQKCGQFRNKSDPKVLALLIQQMIYSNGLLWTVFGGNYAIEESMRFLLENLLDAEPSSRVTSKEDLKIFSSIFKIQPNDHGVSKPGPEKEKE